MRSARIHVPKYFRFDILASVFIFSLCWEPLLVGVNQFSHAWPVTLT